MSKKLLAFVLFVVVFLLGNYLTGFKLWELIIQKVNRFRG